MEAAGFELQLLGKGGRLHPSQMYYCLLNPLLALIRDVKRSRNS